MSTELAPIPGWLKPGVSLMYQQRFAAKFALITGAFVIPVIVLLTSVVRYAADGIDFAQQERQGVLYLPGMQQALRQVGEAAGTSDAARRVELLQAADETLRGGLGQDSLSVRGKLPQLTATGADPVQLLKSLRESIVDVADVSNLTLDPDLDSYYTMAAVTDQAPALVIALGAAAQRGAGDAQSREQVATELTALRRLVQRADAANAQLGLGSALSAVTGADGVPTVAGVTQFMTESDRKLDALLEKRIGGFSYNRNMMLAITALSLLAAAYLVTCFYLSSLRGFSALRERMDKIARVDPRRSYDARGVDEIGEVINALNQLQVMVNAMHHVAGELDQSGRTLIGVNEEMAQHHQSQEVAVSEALDSVGQIAGNVARNHEHSGAASRCSEQACTVAERGKQVVDEVVQTMQTISQSSKRIGDITTVIDAIAFQTNLLALNAAVEAARAGEQGRGFAVVASEVRQLAQRSASAAREIKGLIATSLQDVGRGAELVGNAGTTMAEMVGSVREVSGFMQKVAEASDVQHQDVGRITQAMKHIQQGTDQSARLMERSGAVASALQDHVRALLRTAQLLATHDEVRGGHAVAGPVGELALGGSPAPAADRGAYRARAA